MIEEPATNNLDTQPLVRENPIRRVRSLEEVGRCRGAQGVTRNGGAAVRATQPRALTPGYLPGAAPGSFHDQHA